MFEDLPQFDSIIFTGFMLCVYEAIVIIMFYFLSPIVMMILYSIFNSDITMANHGAMYSGEFYFITAAMFAIAFLIPLAWFILKVFRVESGYQIRRY